MSVLLFFAYIDLRKIIDHLLPVGIKTKNTAPTRQRKAATWFQWSFSPERKKTDMMVNTVRVITSCTTLSCIIENGPPFSTYPILLAGIMKQYSSRAIPQEKRITAKRGQFFVHPSDCIFR